jgi:hypothetical protein
MIMKYFACLFLFLISGVLVFGQKTFEVQDFSPDYYGKVYLEKPEEVFSKGWVAIYRKKTNKQLIKINSDALTGDAEEDGKIKANVKELPYGEQSAIIYEDFNFDGVKDFAIMDGQNSCYGGPSFQIFLAGKTKGIFTLSKPFTELAQEYCGMFEVKQKEKKITTMTKSGCCWHKYSEFVVVNNRPKAVKIVEEDLMNSPFLTVTTEIWNERKKNLTSIRTVDFQERGAEVLFSFKTADAREVKLFVHEGGLHYIFINKNGNIDFAYPRDSGQENPTFTLDTKENTKTLSFANKGATYKIYETENEKIGVQVNVNGKTTDILGDSKTRKGSLLKVVEANPGDVNIKK